MREVHEVSSHKRFKAVVCSLLLPLMLLPLALSQVGCGSKKPVAPPPPQYLSHVIQYPGETLSIIAAWYTGSSKNWQEIAAVNPDLRPNRLKKGMTILVPQELLVKESPLPKRFVDSLNARARSSAPTQESGESSGATSLETTSAPPPLMEEASLMGAETGQIPAPPSLPDPTVSDLTPTKRSEVGAAAPNIPAETKAIKVEGSNSAAELEAERQRTRDRLLQELLSEK